MNHSLLGADRHTHLKILAVALVGATLVIGVGIGARMTDATTAVSRVEGPVLKAGKPSAFTSRDTSSIR